jgi:multisubunit Na+/H+ antiporter MnhE subunit
MAFMPLVVTLALVQAAEIAELLSVKLTLPPLTATVGLDGDDRTFAVKVTEVSTTEVGLEEPELDVTTRPLLARAMLIAAVLFTVLVR